MDPIARLLDEALEAEKVGRADLERIVNAAPDHATAAERVATVFPEWRRGQVYMNVLRVDRPDLYDEVTGTEHDCFYDDRRLPQLIQWLAVRTEQQPGAAGSDKAT